LIACHFISFHPKTSIWRTNITYNHS
jgi:hypothetical protein